MEDQQWTAKSLHQIADIIYNLIKQSDSRQVVSEIDAARKVASVHPLDPQLGFDLHKIVNNVTIEVGRNEKARINLPSEMAFERERISLQNCNLIREHSSSTRSMVALSPEMLKSVSSLISHVKHHLTFHAHRVLEHRLIVAKHRTQLFNEITADFIAFLAEADLVGIAYRAGTKSVCGSVNPPHAALRLRIRVVNMLNSSKGILPPEAGHVTFTPNKVNSPALSPPNAIDHSTVAMSNNEVGECSGPSAQPAAFFPALEASRSLITISDTRDILHCAAKLNERSKESDSSYEK
ncbi:hypothetical protein Bhyg_03743 [Pseudolycoriella hygida]|uniref:Uncharacterized protein n=1 Tax=Pseudolycoriella hygida TaxID=35572 RepID=A0A9Q0NDW0_9DIPT|nr:hypothetical protein Bhyg_03743 [Pseudolycoriella hygida]